MTKIKICGLKRKEDIEIVNEFLPDYAGFVINFPKSKRGISSIEATELSRSLNREKIKAVGVFVDEPLESVAELLNDGTLDYAQLHGNEDEEYIKNLRNLVKKENFIIKAFKAEDLESLRKAKESTADFLLLDKGQGTGETFDWSVLETSEGKEIFNEIKTKGKWFLAGGLNEENLKAAISKLKPWCVDLSSGAETNGFKDKEKVKRLIEITRLEN